MINLLPEQYKNKIKREYYMRMGIIAAFFLLGLVVMAAIFLLPSYLLISIQEKVEKNELAAMAARRDPELESVSTTIQTIKQSVSIFGTGQRGGTFSESVIAPVVDARIPGIVITEFTYTTDPLPSLSIRGNALSRDILLAYVEKLESLGTYQKIQVPINDLLEINNVEFNLKLVKKADEKKQ